MSPSGNGSAARFTSVLLTILPCVSGHAYVYWPASRNWKVAPHIAHCFNVPGPAVNFQTAHNAGGKAGPSDFAKGMCGNFGAYGPQSNLANDGIANWAEAAPVATYQSGGPIKFTIVNNAEHGGHYEFRLCDRKLDASIGSREDAARCFDAHFLGRECVPLCGCDSDRCKSNAEHNDKNDPIYSHGEPRHLQQGGHQVELQLPKGLTCETCTIQWFWHTAWGEQFWNCIDVRIEGGGGSVNPTLAPPLTTTVTPATTTPSSAVGGDPCLWTTPLGRVVTMRKQSEKPGRICWEFTVPQGTTVHYQSKVDIYHWWNAETCCLNAGTSSSIGSANVVSFTPEWGNFGFCECIGWTPETGGTTCAGQATPDAMICPAGGNSGNLCADMSALSRAPDECRGAGVPSPTSPSPTLPPTLSPTLPPSPGCALDWGSCMSSRCCASPDFACYMQDASYAECRRDDCPASWSCTVLAPDAHFLPEICSEFCGLAPIGNSSCSSFQDATSCRSHYVRAGSRTMPCSWTKCGECFADGAGMLDCPELAARCASPCMQLCDKVDLTTTSQTCGDLEQSHCERSFHTMLGIHMPCKWEKCGCFADGEALLKCDMSQCATALLK